MRSAAQEPMEQEDLLVAYREMVEWLGEQQVVERGSPHYGAVYYPTEKRYCNRDTACAAAAFMRWFVEDSDPAAKQRAVRAVEYVLGVQKNHGGYPELRGLQESDGGSTVNTAIVADNLIRAFQLGLPHGDREYDALARMADFELTLEWKPGAFYHDTNHVGAFKDQWGPEGSRKDCQNTTALAAMMLQRIFYFLQQNGRKVCVEWVRAAGRAVEHALEGQDAHGHWPYWIGADWQDIGHHAMVMLHLEQAAEYEPFSARPDIVQALEKGAEWLLDTAIIPSRWGSKLDWAVERSACIYFTFNYFVVSAALARLANLDLPRRSEWQREALELLRYVRTRLWDHPFGDYVTEGPFRPTECGLSYGYAWFGQSLGWCLYMLDEVIGQTAGWRTA